MIELRDISRSYTTGGFTQKALDGVSITFRENEFVAVLGPSGSGKTTLLNIIGGLDHFDSGDILISGVSTKDYKDADWDTYRNHRIGFVFQSYNLIPHQTVVSNVELALTLSGNSAKDRRERALTALSRVGLEEHAYKLPSQLSGGQMQRVAIARALVNDPDIVLADEPTGALDTETGLQVMDLLKEIAQDRLVVMVTHNPDLAETYATRIVRLTDGRITADSDPYDAEPEAQASAVRQRRPGMSLFTALKLSFANLMSKKGRTFMTAFAGSIGIIGIAAILALANGVNDYIARTEEEAMSAYPFTITEAATNFSSFISERTGGGGDDEPEDAAPVGYGGLARTGRDVELSDTIPEATIISDMFAIVDSNDLSSLKEFFDSEESGIQEHVNDIVYNYGVAPVFYRADTSDGVHRLGNMMPGSPNMTGIQAMSSFGIDYASNSTSFEEMISNRSLLESQYDGIVGRWPENAHEGVLVLNMRGGIADYTLYSLGILDPDEFRGLMEAFSNDESIAAPDTRIDMTFADALDLRFKVVSPAQTYRYSPQSSSWTDMSDDEDFMLDLLEDSVELTIVGVIMPSEDNDSPTLSEGVAYEHGLTLEMIGVAADTDIVRAQLADPETDVFTGESFEDLRAGTASAFDMGNIFSVNQRALERAFSFDASALASLGQGIDLSGIDLDLSGLSIDPSNITIDTSQLSSLVTQESIVALITGAPAPDFSGLADELDESQRTALAAVVSNIANGFLPYWYQAHPGESITDATDFSADVQGYIATPAVQEQIAQMRAIAGPEFEQDMQDALDSYMDDQLIPYLQNQLASIANQAAEIMITQLTAQLQQEMAKAAQAIGTQLSQQLSSRFAGQMGDLASALQNAFHVDASAFASAIDFNMTQEDLTSLLTNYAQASQLTYENNLTS
ncbi:MAG: ABC transporter ATP-binding protein, partial [Atopobiaceae bacterium]|nr:ABC transporter ATP-binding protein [Atopobiaceae bacterium]